MPNKLAHKKEFFSEVYTFEEAAGFLIKHLVPPNREAVGVAAKEVQLQPRANQTGFRQVQ